MSKATYVFGLAFLLLQSGCVKSGISPLPRSEASSLPFDCSKETAGIPPVAGQSASEICPAALSLYQLFRHGKGMKGSPIEYADTDAFYQGLASSLIAGKGGTVVVTVDPKKKLFTPDDLNAKKESNGFARMRMGLVLDAVKFKGGQACLKTAQMNPMLVAWGIKEAVTLLLPVLIDHFKGDPLDVLRSYDATVKASPGGNVRSQPVSEIDFVPRAAPDPKCNVLQA